MKKIKKLLAVLVAMTMIMAMGMTAFAGEQEEPAAATTGSITVKNATKGHDYTAYKVFDATYSGEAVSYKTSADNADLLDDTLFGWSAEDSEGNINVWALEDASEEDILDWVKENYASFGGEAIEGEFDATNSTVTFSGLDFGYYYITSSLGTAVTIDSAVPTQDVYDKNSVEPEDPEKNIVSVDGEALDDPAKSADAHVGSIVGFKITAKTTNWIGEQEDATIREEWEVTDTPTNMDIDLSSVVVKFNDTALTKDTDYTATIENGTLTINVPMVDDDGNSIFDAPKTDDDENGLIPIEITYSATITADAGSAPAKNEIPGDGTEIFTYAFQVTKTDGSDPLPGAQFELWYDGEALTFIDNGDGTYTYSADGEVTTLDMTTNTTISILGLDKTWDYTLKEVTVPEGYNPADDIEVSGSDLTKVEENTDTSMDSISLYNVEVENKQGAELPSTGGVGTTIFYVVGAVLVLGAGVLMVTRRRMSN